MKLLVLKQRPGEIHEIIGVHNIHSSVRINVGFHFSNAIISHFYKIREKIIIVNSKDKINAYLIKKFVKSKFTFG